MAMAAWSLVREVEQHSVHTEKPNKNHYAQQPWSHAAATVKGK